MKNLANCLFCVFILLVVMACSRTDSFASSHQGGESEDSKDVMNKSFALGADISWCTEYEQDGRRFFNNHGQQRECTVLMKELGLNAIRLRVWVNPEHPGNFCNVADVVEKAKRARLLDMDVMIDFHYSDWWADPAQQYKPAAWKDLNLVQLKKAIASHTREVLDALKQAGVTPKWVQVGNEIRSGMLWDEDLNLSGASYDVRSGDVKGNENTSDQVLYPANWRNLADFINVGYDTVKEVCPESFVIVHLDNGWDKDLFKWFFDELKRHGGKWDMIGMSLYPYWTRLSKPDYSPDDIIADCIQNINTLGKKFDCDVMLVETGVECADDSGKLASEAVLKEGKRQLLRILKSCSENTGGRCKGVFYWEPECSPSQYRLGAFTEDGRPTVIMEAFR